MEDKLKSKEQKTKNEAKVRAFKFSIAIIKLVQKKEVFRTCNAIARQLTRCGTSIGANIVEANASHSRKDFARYLRIALRSGNETKYWLSLLLYVQATEKKLLKEMTKECSEICNMLGASLITLQKDAN